MDGWKVRRKTGGYKLALSQTGSQGRFEGKLGLEQDENTPTGVNDNKNGNVNPAVPRVDGSAPVAILTR